MPPALFVPVPGGARATELTRGPWTNHVMHGGAICGLLGWAVETEMRRLGNTSQICSRLTVEILSGMPMAPYAVMARAVKPGRRTSVIEAELRAVEAPSRATEPLTGGRLVARASSQWLAPTIPLAASGAHEMSNDVKALPPIPPERADPGAHSDIEYPRPGFNADGVDIRFVDGSTEEPGRGLTWIRLDHELMAGETTTPFGRVASLCDLGAAVGWDYSPSGGAYINTDVTLQLLREPVGEWILFDSATDSTPQGLACCHSEIADQQGRLGWVLQSQVEAPSEMGFPGGMNVAVAARDAAASSD